MRKISLILIFLFILFVPVYFSKQIIAIAGLSDLRGGSRAVIGLIAVVLAVVVLTILTLLNRRILDWRKTRGRDIEEEERYESDHGMISLNPKDEDHKE